MLHVSQFKTWNGTAGIIFCISFNWFKKVLLQETVCFLRREKFYPANVPSLALGAQCSQWNVDYLVLSYMTYKIWGHTPSNPTFYFDPAKKTEHSRCDGTSSYRVTALFLESLVTAYRYHIRTQIEKVHFLYISRINLVSFCSLIIIFLRSRLVYSLHFNYVMVIV